MRKVTRKLQWRRKNKHAECRKNLPDANDSMGEGLIVLVIKRGTSERLKSSSKGRRP